MFHNLFTGIFDSSTTTVISVPEFLLCVGVSLVIGVILAAAYAYKTRYNPGFVRTLAILPAVVCVVIMMVNGNVGTALPLPAHFHWYVSEAFREVRRISGQSLSRWAQVW